MLRFLTAGESHGPQLTALLEGFPAGVPLNMEAIQRDMQRRKIGTGSSVRQKLEDDRVEILSGVREGKTIGSPITLVLQNREHENRKGVSFPAVTAPRPGHADLAGALKYGFDDARNVLERASARETAARVAVGAVCRQFLELFGMEVQSRVVQIGSVAATRGGDVPTTQGEGVTKAMEKLIAEARTAGDTLGGALEVWAQNVPPGLGSHVHWDRRLDGQIAQALMSIPSVKAVEIGDGIAASARLGSQVHDEIFSAPRTGGTFYRTTNRAGGTEGGMSNGEPVLARVYLKPLSTLMKPLKSVDMRTGRAAKAAVERSDVCVVPRAAVIAESMLAFVLAQNFLEKFGGDCLEDIQQSYRHYQKRIKKS